MGRFAEEVAQFAFKAKERMEYAAKKATLDLAKQANTPEFEAGPFGSGLMHYNTGFLHNSLAAAYGHMPSGPSVGPVKNKDGNIVGRNDGKRYKVRDPMGDPDISDKVMGWSLKMPLYVGWTAEYSLYREEEANDRFMADAVMHWDSQFVPEAVQQAKVLFP